MTIQHFQETFQLGCRYIAETCVTPDFVEELKRLMMTVVNLFMEDTGLVYDPVDSVRLDVLFDLPPDVSLGFDTSTALQDLQEFLAAA